MKMLSKFVYKTFDQNQPILYDTVQRVKCPPEATYSDLADSCFLEGMEPAAIKRRLLAKPQFLKLTVVPKWDCNLRCIHCCVSHRFRQSNNKKISPQALGKFLADHALRYDHKRATLNFSGGEPLLFSGDNLEIINCAREVAEERQLSLSVTVNTNLTVQLHGSVLEFLRQCDGIGVSLDGDEKHHNEQRIALNGDNPFTCTVSNIKRLMQLGFRQKLGAVAALSEPDLLPNYYRMCMKLGFLPEHIFCGLHHPTDNNKAIGQHYCNMLKVSDQFTAIPCCKYRYMSNFLVSPDGLYTDFYVHDRLGSLEDPLDLLEREYEKSIYEEMPVLQDTNCQSCPVLGLCWGRCSQNNIIYNKKPSDFCNRSGMMARAALLAKEGKLISEVEKNYVHTR